MSASFSSLCPDVDLWNLHQQWPAMGPWRIVELQQLDGGLPGDRSGTGVHRASRHKPPARRAKECWLLQRSILRLWNWDVTQTTHEYPRIVSDFDCHPNIYLLRMWPFQEQKQNNCYLIRRENLKETLVSNMKYLTLYWNFKCNYKNEHSDHYTHMK